MTYQPDNNVIKYLIIIKIMLQEITNRSSDSTEIGKRSAADGKKETRSSDRSKKKSWYSNILYPTYKTRSDNFKKIFKDVPDEERLIVGK